MQGWISYTLLQHEAVVSHTTMPLRESDHQGVKTDHSENSTHVPEFENHYKERLRQNSNVSPVTSMCKSTMWISGSKVRQERALLS